MLSNDDLMNDLEYALVETEKLIGELAKEADGMGCTIYQVKNSDGSFAYFGLLKTKAELIRAIVDLKGVMLEEEKNDGFAAYSQRIIEENKKAFEQEACDHIWRNKYDERGIFIDAFCVKCKASALYWEGPKL